MKGIADTGFLSAYLNKDLATKNKLPFYSQILFLTATLADQVI
jgi:hypothetical protein